MEKRLDSIEDAVKDIRDKVQEIAVDTAENKIHLQEHMRRTEAVEKHCMLLEQAIKDNREESNRKISPLQKFADRTKFLFYVIGVAAGIVMFFHKLGLLSF